MKKTLITVVAVVAMLTVTAPLAAAKPGNGNGNGNGHNEAAKLCVELKQADKEAFEAVWGKNAMRNCKRAAREDDPVATTPPETFQNAAQECRAEREADPAGFVTTYGTNGNGRNAFGKCVSTKVHEDEETETPTA